MHHLFIIYTQKNKIDGDVNPFYWITFKNALSIHYLHKTNEINCFGAAFY